MIIKKFLTVATGLASMITIMAATLTIPAYAQGPKAVVKVEVQDVTDGTPFVDANEADAALHVAPGDTLTYRFTFSNPAAPASNGQNDLKSVAIIMAVSVDTGIVDDPSTYTVIDGFQVIYDNSVGTLAPGQNTVRTYTAKVATITDGANIIGAGAHLEGKTASGQTYKAYDDYAYVVVDAPDETPTTPTTPETPSDTTPKGTTTTTPTATETPETPETPQTPQTPVTTAEKLPNTGSSAGVAMIFALLAGFGGYAINTLRLRRNS